MSNQSWKNGEKLVGNSREKVVCYTRCFAKHGKHACWFWIALARTHAHENKSWKVSARVDTDPKRQNRMVEGRMQGEGGELIGGGAMILYVCVCCVCLQCWWWCSISLNILIISSLLVSGMTWFGQLARLILRRPRRRRHCKDGLLLISLAPRIRLRWLRSDRRTGVIGAIAAPLSILKAYMQQLKLRLAENWPNKLTVFRSASSSAFMSSCKRERKWDNDIQLIILPVKASNSYRTKVELLVGLLWLAAAAAKVEAAAEATAAEVAAGEDAAGEQDALAPARGEQVVGAHVLLAQLLRQVQAHWAVVVVQLALLFIRENGVCSIDVLELLCRLRIVRILVRVVP